ncbi:MAG: prefoldin subunit beta [Candidatus Woesearchaeota archaeon]
MAEAEISQLHLLQQNMQNILLQKQQLQRQSAELESALKELVSSPQAYKILGNIMVSADKENLTKDLQERAEVTKLRLKSFERQEEALKKKTEEIQEKVLANIKNERGKSQ